LPLVRTIIEQSWMTMDRSLEHQRLMTGEVEGRKPVEELGGLGEPRGCLRIGELRSPFLGKSHVPHLSL
jgi:hypothetical protein